MKVLSNHTGKRLVAEKGEQGLEGKAGGKKEISTTQQGGGEERDW